MTEKLGVFFLHCEDGLVDSTNTFTNVTNTNSAFAVYSGDARSGSNSMSATCTSEEDVIISFSTPSNTAALNFEENTAGAVTALSRSRRIKGNRSWLPLYLTPYAAHQSPMAIATAFPIPRRVVAHRGFPV